MPTRLEREMEFRVFCHAREWQFSDFRSNGKNKKQYIGRCHDNGTERFFLISEKGAYYELLGNKQFRPTDFVLEENRVEKQTTSDEA